MTVRAFMTRDLPKLEGGREVELLPRLSSLLFDLRTMALRCYQYLASARGLAELV